MKLDILLKGIEYHLQQEAQKIVRLQGFVKIQER